MASFSIKIEGLEALRVALRKLPEDLQSKELANATAAGAVVIRDEAKARAPILRIPDPRRIAGTLRNMIRSTRGKRNDSEAASFVSVRRLSGKKVTAFKKANPGKGSGSNPEDPFYWRFVEFGTSKMPAQPFLRPAFDSKAEEAANKIKEALRAGIERSAKRVAGNPK